jgi:hypothetical protein
MDYAHCQHIVIISTLSDVRQRSIKTLCLKVWPNVQTGLYGHPRWSIFFADPARQTIAPVLLCGSTILPFSRARRPIQIKRRISIKIGRTHLLRLGLVTPSSQHTGSYTLDIRRLGQGQINSNMSYPSHPGHPGRSAFSFHNQCH